MHKLLQLFQSTLPPPLKEHLTEIKLSTAEECLLPIVIFKYTLSRVAS